MAKHRATFGRPKPGGAVAGGVRRLSPSAILSGAAVVTAAAVGGLAATTPGSVSSSPVELSALVVVGSSTNPTGDGIREFYGGKFDRADEDVVTINFMTGPLGIYRALYENRDDDDNVVLSSGWGAANASLLLTYLAAAGSDDPALKNSFYVLDNNVASRNGGFGTRLPMFAFLGVNPIPTPTAPGVRVINVVYEYDINSNIPAYVLNGPAMANSLLAYFERRLNQEELVLPVDEQGNSLVPEDCGAQCEYETDDEGMITFTRVEAGRYEFTTADGDSGYIEVVDDTTYVSYKSKNVPLVAPLRLLGEPGNKIADLTEPALRAAVNYGYPDNDPLANPDDYVPARLVPRPQETQRFVNDFADGVEEGLATLDDDSSPVDHGVEVCGADGRHRRACARRTEEAAFNAVRKSLDFTPKFAAEGNSTRRPGPSIIRATIESVGELSKRLQGDREDGAHATGNESATRSELPSPADNQTQ